MTRAFAGPSRHYDPRGRVVSAARQYIAGKVRRFWNIVCEYIWKRKGATFIDCYNDSKDWEQAQRAAYETWWDLMRGVNVKNGYPVYSPPTCREVAHVNRYTRCQHGFRSTLDPVGFKFVVTDESKFVHMMMAYTWLFEGCSDWEWAQAEWEKIYDHHRRHFWHMWHGPGKFNLNAVKDAVDKDCLQRGFIRERLPYLGDITQYRAVDQYRVVDRDAFVQAMLGKYDSL